MKQQLTQEEIQFIDNYLKNSGVEYIDTRSEVVDHVASEIENRFIENNTSDFYEEFKMYMIQHKKALLKNIHKYRWALDKRILKQVVKNLFHQKVLAFQTLFLVISITLLNTSLIDQVDFKAIHIVIAGSVVFLSLIYPFFWFRKQKISVINRSAVLCYFINYLVFDLVLKIVDDYIFTYSISLVIITWFNISFAFTQVNYFKFYKDKFLLS
ncbi:hypothetical protein [Mesonia aestuariivivens]|uniref:DUF1129 family protein n=1 Tax=Mesonia aestuariivivens TaxID=2796128 RepID=A0ABS6VY20_9FLAO|nr:hypothetical protein [Mesonia aestuariivivens]MBW2960182.1 hypothetical protein [Mesonia aestuariivivens]